MVTVIRRSGLYFGSDLWMLLVLFLLLPFENHLQAQYFSPGLDYKDSTQVHILKTQRGDKFIGRLLRVQQDSLTFALPEADTLFFARESVKKVYPSVALSRPRNVSSFVPSSLSVAPTAFNLDKDQWNYQNVNVLGNNINYGVSDHFSVGSGFIVPGFFIWKMKWTGQVTPNFSVGVHNLNLIGVASGIGTVSTLSVVGTVGHPDRFFNFNLGKAWLWGESESLTYVAVGTSKRFNNRLGGHFTLNGLTLSNGLSLFPTLALNYYGKNNALSLGLAIETDQDILGFIGIPVLKFSQNF